MEVRFLTIQDLIIIRRHRRRLLFMEATQDLDLADILVIREDNIQEGRIKKNIRGSIIIKTIDQSRLSGRLFLIFAGKSE